MKMSRLILIGLVFLLASTIGALCQNHDRKSQADALRKAMEGDIKREFEDLKQRFHKTAKTLDPQWATREQDLLTDAAKAIAYNKAYIYFSCALSLDDSFG